MNFQLADLWHSLMVLGASLLRPASLFPLAVAEYQKEVGEVFLSPLSVITHKWMIAVSGLALGLMIFVPIILSVLYRVIWAMVAVVIVALVAHAPVLAATLAIGCMLAARTPLRSDVPFVAVLLGLLPPALYLSLFSSLGSEGAALPVEQLLLEAPLLVAMVTAVLSGAVVLWLARLTDYRSGVVWPVVAVLVAAPILLFSLRVGRDELEYNLMTAWLAPTDSLLEPSPLKQWLGKRGLAAANASDTAAAVRKDLEAQKGRIIHDCERFLAHYPQRRGRRRCCGCRRRRRTCRWTPVRWG